MLCDMYPLSSHNVNSLFCDFLCSLVLIWRRPPCLVVKMSPWDWLEGERIKMVPKDQDHLQDHRQVHLPIVHLTYRGWLVPSPTNQSKVCYSCTTMPCTVSPFMSWNWSLILFLCPLSSTWVTCTCTVLVKWTFQCYNSNFVVFC